jgi:predicted dehydrogenase
MRLSPEKECAQAAAAVRVALLGCGWSAGQIHLPILLGLRAVTVVALAECDRELRATACRRARNAAALDDYRDALARDDVEGVVVCLPTALHAEAAIAAFAHGKHVYLEKPLATSLVDGDRAIAAWQSAGTVGMVGFNFRYNRLYHSARQHLEAGAIGDLVAARSVFSVRKRDLPAWKTRRRSGGGVLLDFASHHVDLVRFLFGREVVSVFAKLRSRQSEDDTLLLELELAGGLPVQSLFSYAAVDEERFEIYGEAGKLTVDRSRCQDVLVTRPGRDDARFDRLAHAVRSLSRAPYVLEKRRTPGHEPSHRSALLRFADAIRGRAHGSPDLHDGLACLEVLMAAERSARTGRSVDVVASRAQAPRASGERGGAA